MNNISEIQNTVKSRNSWRSYSADEIPSNKKQKLQDYISKEHTGPFGNSTKFHLLENLNMNLKGNDKIGTYGFIRGAKHFIVGEIKSNENCMLDYGYLFEKIILFSTTLALGTCWLGASFTRSTFADAINLKESYIIPAISPIGIPTKKRSTRDKIIRWAARAKSRIPREKLFFDGNMKNPLSKGSADSYEQVLEMVRLAPSASNKQPWRIIKDIKKHNYHFFLQRTKGYKKLLNSVDLQLIDMGIAMCHFELTARALGLQGGWEQIGFVSQKIDEIEYITTWKSE